MLVGDTGVVTILASVWMVLWEGVEKGVVEVVVDVGRRCGRRNDIGVCVEGVMGGCWGGSGGEYCFGCCGGCCGHRDDIGACVQGVNEDAGEGIVEVIRNVLRRVW